MQFKDFSYPIWMSIWQNAVFLSLFPWRRTGSGGTTLLSLSPYVQRGKAWLEDLAWRSVFVDVHVRLLSLSPTNSLIFPLRPPGSFLLLPAGYRWDTLGSISSSEPAQMAAGIPFRKSRQDELGHMTTANCRKMSHWIHECEVFQGYFCLLSVICNGFAK